MPTTDKPFPLTADVFYGQPKLRCRIFLSEVRKIVHTLSISTSSIPSRSSNPSSSPPPSSFLAGRAMHSDALCVKPKLAAVGASPNVLDDNGRAKNRKHGK